MGEFWQIFVKTKGDFLMGLQKKGIGPCQIRGDRCVGMGEQGGRNFGADGSRLVFKEMLDCESLRPSCLSRCVEHDTPKGH